MAFFGHNGKQPNSRGTTAIINQSSAGDTPVPRATYSPPGLLLGLRRQLGLLFRVLLRTVGILLSLSSPMQETNAAVRAVS